jgi:hypothetical protein
MKLAEVHIYCHVFFFYMVKGPAADATAAPQP